jgi:hypothetical protein
LPELDPKTVVLILCGVLAVLAAYLPMDMLVVWLRVQGRIKGTRPSEEQGLPVWIVGSFERLSAFALGLFGVSNAPVILGAWLAAKLAASWGRYPDSAEASDFPNLPDRMELNRQVRVGHLVAVITGVVSVAIGLLTGLFIRHALKWNTAPPAP